MERETAPVCVCAAVKCCCPSTPLGIERSGEAFLTGTASGDPGGRAVLLEHVLGERLGQPVGAVVGTLDVDDLDDLVVNECWTYCYAGRVRIRDPSRIPPFRRTDLVS